MRFPWRTTCGAAIEGAAHPQLLAAPLAANASLNIRLRQTLGFKSPAEVLFEDCFNNKIDINPVIALGL